MESTLKATMESTTRLVIVNGLNLRVWEGVTEKGVPFIALVNRLESLNGSQMAAMVQELSAAKPPSETVEPTLIRMGVVVVPPAAEPAAGG